MLGVNMNMGSKNKFFYPQNLHTHTFYCDGKDDCESVVKKAIEIGFTGIGFSGHSHADYIPTKSTMTFEDTAKYKKDIALLKDKYADKIDVFCGLEFDMYSDDDQKGYDYIIGTNHYLKVGNELVGFDRAAETVKGVIDNYFGGDGLAFAKEYYRQLSELPKYGKFDIVGHFDLISKNCEILPLFDEEDERYKKYAIDCLYALKEKIDVFEINTGAMTRGYRTSPYPRPFILKELVKAGAGITLGSDCHDKNYLDYGFDYSINLCKECGVKELQILTKGGFKGIALE